MEFARLDALGMRILPVPRLACRPDLEVMARYCELHKPKLFVGVCVFHNPTGYCLTPGSAHRVLQLTNTHNFHIVEDDTDSHIAPEHATRLCALDGLQRTIYVSGFAKIQAPGWREGFLAAPLAGVFVWEDSGGNTDAWAQRRLNEGCLLMPDALFRASRQPRALMRINFSTTQEAEFWRVCSKMRAEL